MGTYRLHEFYDEVLIGDARKVALPAADIVTLGDVAQHMTESDGPPVGAGAPRRPGSRCTCRSSGLRQAQAVREFDDRQLVERAARVDAADEVTEQLQRDRAQELTECLEQPGQHG